MKRVLLILLLWCWPQLANAAHRIEEADLPPRVMEVIRNEISARFDGATVLEMHMSDPMRDADTQLPKDDANYFLARDQDVNITNHNQLGLLFAFTSPKPFDRKYTHGSKLMDNLFQFLLRGARNDSNVRYKNRTVLAERTLPDYMKVVIWVKIEIPPGNFNPVRRDIVYRPELADTSRTLRELIARAQARADSALKIANDARRIAQGAFGKHDVGLVVFPGVMYAKVNDVEYTGILGGAGLRFRGLYLEYYAGKRFSDNQSLDQNFQLPEFSNDHFDGYGAFIVSPIKDKKGNVFGNDYGYFYRIGVTHTHLQKENILNIGSTDSYLTGLTIGMAVPMKFATPEISGTVGAARTVFAQPIQGQANDITRGFGCVLRFDLAFGYR